MTEAIAVTSFEHFLDEDTRRLVLVDPDTRRLELARPVNGAVDAWEVSGPGEVLATEFGDIDVDALYDSIDRTATTS